MDEELKMAIKVYGEFQSILGTFAASLQSVERAEKAVASSADALTKVMAQLLDAIQKTGPPNRQMTEEEKAKAEALRKAREQARLQAEELKKKSQADRESAAAAKAEARAQAEAVKQKAQADREAAAAANEHQKAVDGLLQGLGALGILQVVKQGIQGVVEAGAGLNQQLGIQRGLTGQAIETSQAYLMGLERQQKGVTELAVGLNELGRAGYTGTQGMEALPELATFATAAMDGLEKSMAPVVTILKVFEKDVRDTGEVTDVLTMSANRSALGFDDFQLALAMSAGVAKLAGMDYRELISVLSVLRDAGLSASDGGTSLKSALMALMNPTNEAQQVMRDLGIQVYDNQGRMKSWADIVANVEQAMKPLNDQSRNLALTTMFGSDGVRAMALSMGRGSEYIRALTEDLRDSRGATAELAHEMGNTFNGALQRTQANLEKLKVLVFEDVKGAIAGLLAALDTLVVGFNSLGTTGRVLIEILVGGVGLTAAIAAVATLSRSTLIPVLNGLATAFNTTATAAGGANLALTAMGGWIGVGILAVGALATAWLSYAGAQEKARQEAERKGQVVLTLTGRYDELQRVLGDSTKSSAEHTQAEEEQQRVIKELGELLGSEFVTKWDAYGNAVGLATEKVNAHAQALQKLAQMQNEVAFEKAKAELSGLLDEAQRQKNQIAEQHRRASEQGIISQADAARLTIADSALVDQDFGPQLAKARAEVQRLWAMLYDKGGDSSDTGYLDANGPAREPRPPGGQTYDPEAAKRAQDADKARVAAIRDQMDLLRHLVAMDDQRVDTAEEQLSWLQRTRAELGTTRELDEAIYKIQTEIARAPLQDQLDAFERRQRLGEVTARQEQEFYEDLVARAGELRLTEQERQEYQVKGILARRAAERELREQTMDSYRYSVEMTDASTAAQLAALQMIRDGYAEGSKERHSLDLEVRRLERQLQRETHEQALAEIDFEAIVQRQTEDQKLARLRQYLATAKDLTVEQRRDLQRTVAQMEVSAERDHQQTLLDLFREGFEAQRRLQEQKLRNKQRDDEQAKRDEIERARESYDGPNGLITSARRQLELMQEQTRELERQTRLLDLQRNLQEKDQELADVRAIKNRVVVESGGPLGFRIRRTHDEAQERELLKERAEIAKDLADEQAKQAREREQERLQKAIQALETERDAKLKVLNTELEQLRTKHAEQIEALNTYWTERLSTQSLNQALEKTAWRTHFDDVKRETEQWVKDMNVEYAKLQKPAHQTGTELAKALGGTVTPPAGSASTSGASSPPAAAGGASAVVNNYGANHYYGVSGVEEAARAFKAGFRLKLR